MTTVRLTVGQATIRFLVNQYVESDGHEDRLIAGAFGIFGHGNVAGLGQALCKMRSIRNQMAVRCRTTCLVMNKEW